MNYIEILSMILNSDDKLTKDYAPLLQSIDTRFFVDKSLISDTPSYQNTGKGFIAIYERESEVVLEFMFGGPGSIKSCTKKVVLCFSSCIGDELKTLRPDQLTNDIVKDVFDLSIFCMNCTAYNLQRDSVDHNQIIEKEIYSIDYYLRKNKNNKYFLQADLLYKKPLLLHKDNITKNRMELNKSTIPFIIVSPDFQNILRDYVNPPSNNLKDMIDDFDEEHNDDFYDDFDEEFDENFEDDFDEELGENPFDALSKLGPGTYDLGTGEFTADNEDIESDDDFFGL